MATRTDQFEQRIAALLRKAHVTFRSKVAIEGLQPDFVISDHSGNFIVLEAKTWEPNETNLQRAAHQAALYQSVTKAKSAYIVIDGLDHGNPEAGILALSEVGDVVRSAIPEKVIRSATFRSFQSPEDIVFAAMPFSPEYDDIFFIAMSYAAKSVGAVCRRVDFQDFAGDTVTEIKRLIHSSIAIIADLSESKANVLYEVGYAHALERPTVHICSTPVDQLPFDVRNWNTLLYQRGQTFAFQERLSARLQKLLDRK